VRIGASCDERHSRTEARMDRLLVAADGRNRPRVEHRVPGHHGRRGRVLPRHWRRRGWWRWGRWLRRDRRVHHPVPMRRDRFGLPAAYLRESSVWLCERRAGHALHRSARGHGVRRQRQLRGVHVDLPVQRDGPVQQWTVRCRALPEQHAGRGRDRYRLRRRRLPALPERTRVQHLPRLSKPVLCGERDVHGLHQRGPMCACHGNVLRPRRVHAEAATGCQLPDGRGVFAWLLRR